MTPAQIDHEIPDWPGPDLDTPLERLARYARLIRAHSPDLVTPEMAAYLHGEIDVPVRPDTRVLAHADLKGEHLLFDEMAGRLTAVIDWADLSLSDPAVDLGYLAIWLGPRFMTDVGRRIGASTEMMDRALFGMRSYMLIGLGSTLAGEKHWPLELARTQLRAAFPGDDR